VAKPSPGPSWRRRLGEQQNRKEQCEALSSERMEQHHDKCPGVGVGCRFIIRPRAIEINLGASAMNSANTARTTTNEASRPKRSIKSRYPMRQQRYAVIAGSSFAAIAEMAGGSPRDDWWIQTATTSFAISMVSAATLYIYDSHLPPAWARRIKSTLRSRLTVSLRSVAVLSYFVAVGALLAYFSVAAVTAFYLGSAAASVWYITLLADERRRAEGSPKIGGRKPDSPEHPLATKSDEGTNVPQ
jgi:hypothetical protein